MVLPCNFIDLVFRRKEVSCLVYVRQRSDWDVRFASENDRAGGSMVKDRFGRERLLIAASTLRSEGPHSDAAIKLIRCRGAPNVKRTWGEYSNFVE